MYILLSPAKTLDMDCEARGLTKTEPAFLRQETKILVDILKKKDPQQLKHLMGISDKLAALNVARYADFFNQAERPAILAFKGDVYQGLDAQSLSDEALNYATRHVGILSGLYGLLRASDAMRAYRLEMGTSLATERGKNLYEFWGDRVASAVNKNLQDSNSVAVVNLASNEYAKVIAGHKIDKPVIDIAFKEVKNGQEKTIAIYAKKARGMMARFMVEKQIKEPEDLQKFDVAGYKFIKQASNDKIMTFRRTHS